MNIFIHEELKVLEEKYRLTMQMNPSTLSIRTLDLLNEQQLYPYLVKVKEITKAANVMVAASLFVKRYSFAVLIALYCMSALNKRIDFSLENISIETLYESDMSWLPSFRFHQLSLEEGTEQNRMTWRDETLKQIFCDHVDVVFTRLSKECKLPKLIMWESLYSYVQWMYESLLNDSKFTSRHEIIAADLHYMLKEGAGSLFGLYHQNPFLKYNSPKQYIEKHGEFLRIRKTCCFSYLTADKKTYCKTCPVICEAKRTQS